MLSFQIERLNMLKAQSYLREELNHSRIYSEVARNIEISGRHLLTMINDILDFSRAEVGKIRVEEKRFNLRDLLEEVEVMIKPFALEKALDLRIDTPDMEVETDPKLLKQILINLLSNAVKFTEKGSVSLRVERQGSLLKFRVIDTGIGIPKEFQDRLFEAFEQLEPSDHGKSKGTGLGLALSKRLVEILGGQIGVISEGRGKGSEFWFTLPLSRR